MADHDARGPACTCGSKAIMDERQHAEDCARRLWVKEQDRLTEAERVDPTEHVDDDDPRYDGFRIRDYWILTAIGPDDQEAPLWVSEAHARIFHLSIGVSMASDARRLHHLRQYAAWIAEGNPGMGLRIRHFVPEGEPEIFGSDG